MEILDGMAQVTEQKEVKEQNEPTVTVTYCKVVVEWNPHGIYIYHMFYNVLSFISLMG